MPISCVPFKAFVPNPCMAIFGVPSTERSITSYQLNTLLAQCFDTMDVTMCLQTEKLRSSLNASLKCTIQSDFPPLIIWITYLLQQTDHYVINNQSCQPPFILGTNNFYSF